MKKLFRSGTYATVASTAALVVALGGTSYAAAKITSSDIKDGTIQTKDLSSKAQTYAKAVHNDNGTAMTGANTTVLSLNLKKGSYFVTSKGYAFGTDIYAYVRCQLVAPSGNTADTSWWWSGDNESGYSTLVNESVMHIGNAGTVQLKCYGDNASLYGKKLTAIRLASFSNLTGPDVAKVPEHRMLSKH
jgi:hypothetical protein